MSKDMATVINSVIHHLAQTVSLILAFVWFGWQGLVVAFLINWAANTSKYTNGGKL